MKFEAAKYILVFRLKISAQLSNRLPFSSAAGAYLAPDLFNDLRSLVNDLEMPPMVGVTPESEVLRRPEPVRRAVRLTLGEHVSWNLVWVVRVILKKKKFSFNSNERERISGKK